MQKIIDDVASSYKESLDLSSQSLTKVPDQIKSFRWLKRLNLSSNRLTELPEWLGNLTSLEFLDLRHNRIKKLCSTIGNLKNLKILNLRDNRLQVIPEELKGLRQLTLLTLSENRIEIIPEWLFLQTECNLDKNPITDPPIEIYNRGRQSLLNYFTEKARGTQKLFEAKLLIVGEPGAGKTTLMNKFLDPSYTLNPFQASTKGIEIKALEFTTENNEYFRINIWDFGGQEIYHATHQFFLTKRSLYVLVADNRAENTDFNYWLQSVELLSGNSPLIIVQNEKESRKKDINEAGMKERFTSISYIFSFNLAGSPQMLINLVSRVKYEISHLEHIGTELPIIWLQIRKELEKRSKKEHYTTVEEYVKICQSYGMHSKERAFHLSDYLHDLGVFLHFKDNAVLKNWVILKPDWATEAVYKVLDNQIVIDNNGYFNKVDLKKIWNDSQYANMHDELLSLMGRFELCYKLEGADSFIAAQLLTSTKPSYSWDDENNLNIRYDYEFMPKGIITRFIVRLHDYINNQRLVWREGVILQRNDTKAEIIETYGKKEIRIKVNGNNKKEFLAIIIDTIDRINSTYTNLKATKLIPCNCLECKDAHSPNYYEYEVLRKYYSAQIQEERCKLSLRMVKIASLIDDVFGLDRDPGKLQVFISCSTDDSFQKESFKKYIKSIQKELQLSIVDRSDIPFGEKETTAIHGFIEESDVIILLVTQNYLDQHYDLELVRCLDKADHSECLVIPIICLDCLWTQTPLNNIKSITYKNNPVFKDEKVLESALTQTVFEIKNAINNHLTRKKQIEPIV